MSLLHFPASDSLRGHRSGEIQVLILDEDRFQLAIMPALRLAITGSSVGVDLVGFPLRRVPAALAPGGDPGGFRVDLRIISSVPTNQRPGFDARRVFIGSGPVVMC
jgi:hypothetical protein